MTATGNQLTSATVLNRQVDNTETRGVDVQASNRSGGVAGRIESGDSIAFSYSEAISPASVLPGWSGAAPAAIYVRVRDGSLVGTGSSGDTAQFSTDAAGSSLLRLGSVNLHGDFVKSGKTAVFNATLTASTQLIGTTPASVFTVAIGSLSSGGTLNTATAAAMVWTPSALATDLSGNPCSSAPVTETGTLDRDF